MTELGKNAAGHRGPGANLCDKTPLSNSCTEKRQGTNLTRVILSTQPVSLFNPIS